MIILCISGFTQDNTIRFELIKSSNNVTGIINQVDINKLSEPLKAIAAFYSSEYGTNCDGINCSLTSALGLEEQGSPLHKAILKKWFIDNERINKIIDSNCSLPPNTASNNTELVYLTLEKHENKIIVKFKVYHYNHGKENFFSSKNDEFIIKGQTVIVKKLKY